MFASVLNKGDVPKSRFGAGSIISVAVHVALFATVIWYSSRPPAVEEIDPEVKFFAAAPPPPPPPPPPAGSKTPKTEKKVEKKIPKKDVLVQPKEIPVEKPPEAEPQKEEPEAADEDGVEGGVEGGVKGGTVGGVVGGTIGGVVGGTGTGTDVVSFGEGMSRPAVDQRALVDDLYTREAREAHVEGMMIVKCNVLADGTIRNCRVIKPLPHLSEAVVARLQSMKATPGTYQGKPIAIDYVFNFKFQMPR